MLLFKRHSTQTSVIFGYKQNFSGPGVDWFDVFSEAAECCSSTTLSYDRRCCVPRAATRKPCSSSWHPPHSRLKSEIDLELGENGKHKHYFLPEDYFPSWVNDSHTILTSFCILGCLFMCYCCVRSSSNAEEETTSFNTVQHYTRNWEVCRIEKRYWSLSSWPTQWRMHLSLCTEWDRSDLGSLYNFEKLVSTFYLIFRFVV